MIDVREKLSLPSGGSRGYVSLPSLEEEGVGALSRARLRAHPPLEAWEPILAEAQESTVTLHGTSRSRPR